MTRLITLTRLRSLSLFLFLCLPCFSSVVSAQTVAHILVPAHNILNPPIITMPPIIIKLPPISTPVSPTKIIVSSPSAPTFGQTYTNTTGNKVFAHFQMSCKDYGTTPAGGVGSVSGYIQDITEAAAIGIDGFSLDYGSNEAEYQQSLANIFAAADLYNAFHTGAPFTLFLTFDCSTFPEDPSVMASVFSEYANDPAYYQYLGRPFLSTYTGEGGSYANVRYIFTQTLRIIHARGINPYFVPGFNTTDSAGNYVSDTPANDASWTKNLLTGLADGAWQYAEGTGPLNGDSGISGSENKATAVQGAGLTWMGSVMPQYWGAAHSMARDGVARFYNEFYGGEGLAAYWQSIINVQKPSWVQICTWNDLDEASNVTNADLGPTGPWPYLTHSSVPGFYKSKTGLQKSLSYYIQYYKTGHQPALTNDTLVAYYRTQPAALVPAADPLGPIAYAVTENGASAGTRAIPDVIFVDCYLAQAADVTLTVGGTTITKSAPAGFSQMRLPFVPGTPKLTLVRSGQTMLTINGEPIVAASEYVNANYYTGTAHD